MHRLVARLVEPHEVRRGDLTQPARPARRNGVAELEEVSTEAVASARPLDETPVEQDPEQPVRRRLRQAGRGGQVRDADRSTRVLERLEQSQGLPDGRVELALAPSGVH